MEALQHEEEKPLSATVPRRTARFRGWLDLAGMADAANVQRSARRHADCDPEFRPTPYIG
jgi:hypothetical protein